jgi:hypothetical protein
MLLPILFVLLLSCQMMLCVEREEIKERKRETHKHKHKHKHKPLKEVFIKSAAVAKQTSEAKAIHNNTNNRVSSFSSIFPFPDVF